MKLHRIVLPYAVCGIVSEDGRVSKAAPIIGWMVGRSVRACLSWVASKGGGWETLA